MFEPGACRRHRENGCSVRDESYLTRSTRNILNFVEAALLLVANISEGKKRPSPVVSIECKFECTLDIKNIGGFYSSLH